MLRYGLIALGIYVVATGLLHHKIAQVVLGAIVIAVAASLFQANRVATRLRDESDRLMFKERK